MEDSTTVFLLKWRERRIFYLNMTLVGKIFSIQADDETFLDILTKSLLVFNDFLLTASSWVTLKVLVKEDEYSWLFSGAAFSISTTRY